MFTFFSKKPKKNEKHHFLDQKDTISANDSLQVETKANEAEEVEFKRSQNNVSVLIEENKQLKTELELCRVTIRNLEITAYELQMNAKKSQFHATDPDISSEESKEMIKKLVLAEEILSLETEFQESLIETEDEKKEKGDFHDDLEEEKQIEEDSDEEIAIIVSKLEEEEKQIETAIYEDIEQQKEKEKIERIRDFFFC